VEEAAFRRGPLKDNNHYAEVLGTTSAGQLLEDGMIKTGKCPKCEQVMTHAIVENFSAKTAIIGGSEYHAVSYQCPSCSTIISIELDPMTMKHDIAAEVVSMLKRQR
jgi:hypothetical protein